MYRLLTILLLLGTLTISACGQTNISGDTLEINWARQQLKSALTDTTQHNVISSKYAVLDNKEKAVSFAERILFDVYGKKQIQRQKPYTIHKIEGYWIIGGTLSKGWVGGTLLIVINSHNCQIVRLTHGK